MLKVIPPFLSALLGVVACNSDVTESDDTVKARQCLTAYAEALYLGYAYLGYSNEEQTLSDKQAEELGKRLFVLELDFPHIASKYTWATGDENVTLSALSDIRAETLAFEESYEDKAEFLKIVDPDKLITSAENCDSGTNE